MWSTCIIWGARGGDRVGEVLFEVIHHERIGSRQVEFLPLFRCALLADGAGGVFERYGDVGEVRIVDEYELYLVGRVVDRADDRLRTAGAVADFTRVERACVGMNSENSASVLQEVTIPAARMMNDNILFFIALSC